VRSAYPTASDLTAFLAAGGITIDATQVGIAVLAGIEAFQRSVGRHMLAGMTVENVLVGEQTRVYQAPPNPFGYIDFEADLVEEPNGIVYEPLDGTPESYAQLTDYILLPQNAVLDGHPYTGLQLRSRWWSPPSWSVHSAIQVTGSWGYGTGIPEDAWQAMLIGGVRALLDMQVISAEGISGASGSWSHEGHSESSSTSSGSSSSATQRMESWQGIWDSVVRRYLKVYL
jgi:hypothetical protein